MQRSEAINEIAAALSKAQGQIENAIKDSVNPHFKSSYADLASVWRACRDQLAANGLMVCQGVEYSEAGVTVTTLLAHTSGQWVSSALTMPVERATPHGIGSCTTYCRRYSLAAMVGVAPDDDDDGNVASDVGERRPERRNGEEDAVRKEINDIRSAIVAAKGTDELTALGELLKDKPQVIKDSVKGLYKSRFSVLKQEEEGLKTAAAAAT